MSRERLPNRRPAEIVRFNHDGTKYALTIGFYFDGRRGEAFTGNAKVGSGVEAVLDDETILISLLLQNGVDPAALARTVGRLGDGTAPASVIGAIVDLLADAHSRNHDVGRWFAEQRDRPNLLHRRLHIRDIHYALLGNTNIAFRIARTGDPAERTRLVERPRLEQLLLLKVDHHPAIPVCWLLIFERQSFDHVPPCP